MAVSHIAVTSLAIVAAAGGVQVVPASNSRVSLTIQNTGTGAVTIGFGSAPTAGISLSLDPASAAAGQGGSRVWDGTDRIPSDSIWAFSTAGSTIVVMEGFAGP